MTDQYSSDPGLKALAELAGLIEELKTRRDTAQARVDELVESEEKAWQKVAVKNIELETFARLKSERDEALSRAVDLDESSAHWNSLLNRCGNAVGMRAGDDMDAVAERVESMAASDSSSRSGLADELNQAEEQSSLFSKELNAVVSLLDERPARNVLFGPGIEDGVAHVVNKRLLRDASRIEKLTAQLANKIDGTDESRPSGMYPDNDAYLVAENKKLHRRIRGLEHFLTLFKRRALLTLQPLDGKAQASGYVLIHDPECDGPGEYEKAIWTIGPHGDEEWCTWDGPFCPSTSAMWCVLPTIPAPSESKESK